MSLLLLFSDFNSLRIASQVGSDIIHEGLSKILKIFFPFICYQQLLFKTPTRIFLQMYSK
jgi:hypothetical protein